MISHLNFKKNNRGIGTVFGMVFFILIVMVVFASFVIILSQNTGLEQTTIQAKQLDLDRYTELTTVSISNPQVAVLNSVVYISCTITNTGTLPAELVRLWIKDNTTDTVGNTVVSPSIVLQPGSSLQYFNFTYVANSGLLDQFSFWFMSTRGNAISAFPNTNQLNPIAPTGTFPGVSDINSTYQTDQAHPLKLSLNTTKTNQLIYVVVSYDDGNTLYTPTSTPSLTWTLRGTSLATSLNSGDSILKTFYAIDPSVGPITITIQSTADELNDYYCSAMAFAVSDVNTASPFDGSAQTTIGRSTLPQDTINIAYSNDLVVGAIGIDDLNPVMTPCAGFGQIMPVQSSYGASGEPNSLPRSVWSEWTIMGDPKNNLPVNCTMAGSDDWAIIVDAIRLVVVPPTAPLSISPTSGPSGQPVTVTGQGFASNSPLIALFGGTQIPFSYTTDSSGNIPSNAVLTVPQGTSAGLKTVTIIDSKFNYASANFTVTTPTININPSNGVVGTTVTVTGSNFIDNSNVVIAANGSPTSTNPSTVTASATGAFSATFSASGTAGANQVTASDGVNSPSASFTINPSITISPVNGINGTQVTVSGQGFAQSSIVTFTFAGTHVTTTPTNIITDAAGTFSGAAFSAYSSTTGIKAVNATDTSGNFAVANFSLVTLSRFTLTGYPSSTVAGTSFGSVTVTAYDSNNNVINGYFGQVYFTSTDSNAVLPYTSTSKYQFSQTEAGTHVFSGFTLKTAGSQTFTVTDGTTSQVSTAITVNPASASTLVVSGFRNPTTANIAGSVTVKATDSYGNTATGYRGTVRFTSSDGAAVLPSNYAFIAGDNGLHTFSGVTLKTAGTQSITATDTVTSTITASQTGIIVNSALVAPTVSASPGAVDQGQSSGLSSTSVTTGTSPYSYQWLQKAAGAGSYSTISGATSSTYYFITSGATTTGSWSFMLQVTDNAGAQVNSSATSVTVNVVPSVTVSPATWKTDVGQSGQTFTATASGGSGSYISYQWYVGGAVQFGSTAQTFSYAPSSVGSYAITATVTDNLLGISAQSSAASFTMSSALVAPTATANQPTVYQGQTSSLTSTAVSTGTSSYTYQWLQQAPGAGSYSAISGATSTTYSFATSSSTTTGVWSFELQVTDSASNPVTVQSSAVTVTVKASHFIDTANAVHDTSVGTHSSFAATQAWPDGSYDTLTEGNVGGGTATFGSATSSTYTTCSYDDFYGSLFTSPADSQGATISSLTAYCRGDSFTTNIKAVIVRASDMTILGVSQVTACSTTAGDKTFTFSTPVTISASTQYIIGLISQTNYAFRFYYSTGSTNQGYVDTSNSYSSPISPTDYTNNNNAYRVTVTYTRTNYQLDLEAQFATVTNYATFTQLQIQTGTFSTPAETLTVDYWNGASWVALGTLSANTLNTFTVSLTANSYQIKFIDGSQTSDTVQSTWQIDSVCLVAP